MSQGTAGPRRINSVEGEFPLSPEVNGGTMERVAMAWAVRLSPIDKLVLLGIAEYGSQTWEALHRVAEFAGCTLHVTMQARRRLQELGYVDEERF